MKNLELRLRTGADSWTLFSILNSMLSRLSARAMSVAIIFLIFPARVLAQGRFTPGLPVEKCGGPQLPACEVDFQTYFSSLVNVGVIVAIAISVIITVYAGILYAQSEGEASKIALAKELIAGCLTGLAILLLIKLILPTLGISTS